MLGFVSGAMNVQIFDPDLSPAMMDFLWFDTSIEDLKSSHSQTNDYRALLEED